MQKSKTSLPDINVWLALVSERHVHHGVARQWFLQLSPQCAAFCRVTQMGFLRLLTNSRVMKEETLDQKQAWEVYERLRRNNRAFFADEPIELEDHWKRLTQSAFPGQGRWTDAYLAAFALGHGLVLVSFDRDFSRITGLEVTLLGTGSNPSRRTQDKGYNS